MMHNIRLPKRKGAVWPLLLACLALMLAGLALAVDAALLWQARQELQVTADACALGAVLELTDDQLLLHQPGSMLQAVDRASAVAAHLGLQHHVLGTPLQLITDNPGDVMFGFYEPTINGMQPAYDDLDNPQINAIEVTARRTRERGTPVGLFFTRLFSLPSADVAASAIAVMDRQVTGFRPIGNINVPMMPLALLSDPSGIEETSWEAQVDKPLTMGGGVDQFFYDKTGNRWLQTGVDSKTGDGLPEFTLRLQLGTQSEDINGCLLQIGKHGAGSLKRQIDIGLTTLDLQEWQGQIELGWDGLLPIEEAQMPTVTTWNDMVSLIYKLQASGEVRIWPLYVPGVSDEAQPATNTVMVRGFVAARIASVQATDDYLELVLQPTVLVTGTALTQPSMVANPYLGKVKLVR